MRERDAKSGPAAKLWICAAALTLAAGLAACTGMGHVSGDAPPNLNLAGTWKLDPQHSTDTSKVLNDALTKARKADRPRVRTGLGQGSDAALLAPPQMVFAPDVSLQRALLEHGDWLKIEQRPDEVVISTGASSRSYVPGEHSVVSVPGGVADQNSGWKSREYWISLKPQVGPSVTETFKLSPDGKQLIEIIDIGRDGHIPGLKVTRVYLPTQEQVPSAVPSED